MKKNTQIVEDAKMAENNSQTQYVDELGNPIDPSLIDASGNYIGETVTQYVDEAGNPIDPSLIDQNGNYIGETNKVQSLSLDQSQIASQINEAAGNVIDKKLVQNSESTPISSSEHKMDDKEMFSGMVTFDYNSVPITDIVNSIILDAINKGASDIHFDPFDEGIKIRIRIDGELNDYSIVPIYVKKNMITRIKIISGMNITESRIPQDGAIRTELANKTIDLRVSCLPTNLGEKIVVRIMDYSMSAAGIEGLDFNEDNLEKVKRMLALPNGIILVTGATGSGKSTTVYSMLQRLNSEDTNIITVEDPIEMNIGGINQVQAVPEIGLDFATVLRSILRQDPDVIMIGEIRDEETAKIAVRASITGHIVLSTIHTNNSLNTIERLTDMDVERYLLGSALSGIISQKLSRRLCEKCKRLRPTNDYEKDMFKKLLDKDVEEIYEPVGCPQCSKGYRGRIAIQEVLLLNQAIKDAIIKNANKMVLRKLVYGENGTLTMLQDGLNKVLEGKTSFEEILKLIDLDDDLGSGTELGLEDQMEAANLGNNNSQTLNGPININITPELLAELQIPQISNTNEIDGNELDEKNDKKLFKKFMNSKKKKKKEIIDKEITVDDMNDDEEIVINNDEITDNDIIIETDDDIIEDNYEDILSNDNYEEEIIDDNDNEDLIERELGTDVVDFNKMPGNSIIEKDDNVEVLKLDDKNEDIDIIEPIEEEAIKEIDVIEDNLVEKEIANKNNDINIKDSILEIDDDDDVDYLLDEELEDIDKLLTNLTLENDLENKENSLEKEINNLSEEEINETLEALENEELDELFKEDNVLDNDSEVETLELDLDEDPNAVDESVIDSLLESISEDGI